MKIGTDSQEKERDLEQGIGEERWTEANKWALSVAFARELPAVVAFSSHYCRPLAGLFRCSWRTCTMHLTCSLLCLWSEVTCSDLQRRKHDLKHVLLA